MMILILWRQILILTFMVMAATALGFSISPPICRHFALFRFRASHLFHDALSAAPCEYDKPLSTNVLRHYRYRLIDDIFRGLYAIYWATLAHMPYFITACAYIDMSFILYEFLAAHGIYRSAYDLAASRLFLWWAFQILACFASAAQYTLKMAIVAARRFSMMILITYSRLTFPRLHTA